MRRTWLDSAAEHALTGAVAELEGGSAVEVVIAVRRFARPWVRVPLAVGAVSGWATLAYMLYGAPAFTLASFLVDPVVVGMLAAAAATVIAPPVRWFVPAAARRRAAASAARATFVERGVHRTRARTGVLVYCALAEQVAAVVPDTGVAAAVPAAVLTEWERRIEQAIAHGGAATADAIRSIAPVFGAALPRALDDHNELLDAVAHDLHRRPRT
jgi:putative membrane protein